VAHEGHRGAMIVIKSRLLAITLSIWSDCYYCSYPHDLFPIFYASF